MGEVLNRGLYVAIGIQPTDGLTNYIEKMPPEYGTRLNPRNRHVTVTYPYDFLEAGIRESDPAPFFEAMGLIEEGLEELEHDGSRIMPLEQVLEPLDKHMAVPIQPSDCIYAAHGVVSRAVKR